MYQAHVTHIKQKGRQVTLTALLIQGSEDLLDEFEKLDSRLVLVAGAPLLLERFRLILQRGRLLEQLLLLGRILLELRLQAEQQALVDQRLHVVGLICSALSTASRPFSTYSFFSASFSAKSRWASSQ